MAKLIGIDCGGTSTRAVCVSETGRLLGVGRGGVGNPNAADRAVVAGSIRDAVRGAVGQAGGKLQEVAAVFLGMAGVVGEDDLRLAHGILEQAVPEVPGERRGIDHDIRIALAGGLAGELGLALIVGTGSSCYGRTADGRTHQAGGWGNILDDGGSASVLGMAAMRAAVRVADGRLPESRILREVMEGLRITEIRQIVDKVYRVGMSKAEVGTLAPRVLGAWEAGDKVAGEIVAEGARELAWIVETAARKLGFAAPPPKVSMSGGMVENNRAYFNIIAEHIRAAVPGAAVVAARLPPVLGAAVLAMEQAGLEHGEGVLRELDSAAVALR
jgi:glucosamine kinase